MQAVRTMHLPQIRSYIPCKSILDTSFDDNSGEMHIYQMRHSIRDEHINVQELHTICGRSILHQLKKSISEFNLILSCLMRVSNCISNGR